MICRSEQIQKDPKNPQLNRNQTYKSKGSMEKQMNPKRIKDSLQDSEQEDAEIQNIASKV